MSAESAFWDLYDRDERGCEAVYVRELEATIERLTGTLPPPVAALLNRAERAEAALATRTANRDELIVMVRSLKAALAERDRMLEDMQMEYLQAALNHGFSIPTLAQRRARAK
jgi:hypothetical protein